MSILFCQYYDFGSVVYLEATFDVWWSVLAIQHHRHNKLIICISFDGTRSCYLSNFVKFQNFQFHPTPFVEAAGLSFQYADDSAMTASDVEGPLPRLRFIFYFLLE